MMQVLNEDRLGTDQFCFWLQGFFELTDSNKLSEKQVQVIKEHLELVFKKVVKTTITTTPNNPYGTEDFFRQGTAGYQIPDTITIC